MGWLLKGDVKSALHSLGRNKFRSLLTMLGIIIGVASVVTIVSISQGVKQQIDTQSEHLGKDLITIRPGQLSGTSLTSELNNIGLLTNFVSTGALNNGDIGVVARTPGVGATVPLSVVTSSVVSGENSHSYNALVVGTNGQFPRILHQSLNYGSFFSGDSSSNYQVIIGSNVAQSLFSENVPLGQTINILGHQFVVAGIFNNFQIAPLSLDVNFNNAVFIPYNVAEQITNNSSPIYEILARPQDPNQTNQVARQLRHSLLVANGGQHNFTVLEQSQTLDITANILNLLTALITGVSAIVLIVSGTGIMNVILVSITERMQEVGIRKAVGATNHQILAQFMTEAAVISVAGAFIGVLVALLINVSLLILTNLTPAFDWQVILLAFIASVVIGLLFGSVPALKAAQKDPIEALRND